MAGVLLALGPAAQAVGGLAGTSSSPVMFCAFALSGCGYVLCLLVWGRILSSEEEDSSSRQVLADTCAAAIAMVAMTAAPAGVSVAAMIFRPCGGLDRPRKTVVKDGRGCEKQVSSATVTPFPARPFVGGTLWLVYGVLVAFERRARVGRYWAPRRSR
ncbi:MAG: hypothetical protein ACLSVD_13970 [Eggerthellaceae bacterium]